MTQVSPSKASTEHILILMREAMRNDSLVHTCSGTQTGSHINTRTLNVSMCWTLFRLFIYYMSEFRVRMKHAAVCHEHFLGSGVCVLCFCATSWFDCVLSFALAHSNHWLALVGSVDRLLLHCDSTPFKTINCAWKNTCDEYVLFILMPPKLIDVQCIIMWTLPYWCVKVCQLQNTI